MVWSWERVATFIEKEFDTYINWEEEFFVCPECGDPVFKADYPMIEVGMLCPICEFAPDEEQGEEEIGDYV